MTPGRLAPLTPPSATSATHTPSSIGCSGWARSTSAAPAMPVVIQHDRLFLGLFGLAEILIPLLAEPGR